MNSTRTVPEDVQTAGIPARAERLVRWSLAPWERAAVLGDLQEKAREITPVCARMR